LEADEAINNTTHVTLKFASFFRRRVNLSQIDFSFEGNTLRHFVEALLQKYDVGDLLLEDGDIRTNVRVVINGRYWNLLGGWEAPIPEGANVTLLESYGGQHASH